MARRSNLRLVTDSHPNPSEGPPPDGVTEFATTIDCDVCVAQFTNACPDCFVTYLVNHEPGTPVVLDDDEVRAVELLADAGLVPPSRFQGRHGVG